MGNTSDQACGYAKKHSVHWPAKEAVTQLIYREESAERFRRENLAAWEEYRQTGESFLNDTVMEWLDSWGTDDERKAPLIPSANSRVHDNKKTAHF